MSLLLLSTTIVTDLADGLFDPYIYIYYNIIYYVYNIYIYNIDASDFVSDFLTLLVVHYSWLTRSLSDP